MSLKPFDKVLCRDDRNCPWRVDMFSRYVEGDEFPYYGFKSTWKECIPYEGNEYLCDTIGEYYKPEFGDLVLFTNDQKQQVIGIVIRTGEGHVVLVPRNGDYLFYIRHNKDISPYKE